MGEYYNISEAEMAALLRHPAEIHAEETKEARKKEDEEEKKEEERREKMEKEKPVDKISRLESGELVK